MMSNSRNLRTGLSIIVLTILAAISAEGQAGYTIRFNKSFDPGSIVYKTRESGIQSGIESLPNLH